MTPAVLGIPGAWVAVPDRSLDLADPDSWAGAAAMVYADDLAVMTAAHGTTAHRVTHGGAQAPGDILVTDRPTLALAALAADCVPVALATSDAIAVVHAGWRGVLAGAATVGIAALAEVSQGPIHAVLGPAICGACYEVPAERVDRFRTTVPAAVRDDTHLDLVAAVLVELADCQVTVIPGCTRERADLCSFRGGDPTRRGGIVIARRAA